jgi:hypothetical protein
MVLVKAGGGKAFYTINSKRMYKINKIVTGRAMEPVIKFYTVAPNAYKYIKNLMLTG